MAWHIASTYYGPCSCNVGCPCELGEPDDDRGWCSGTLTFAIDRGNVDGTDVSGSKVTLVGDWPRGFVSGNGMGHLYFDSAISQKHRAALEAVLTGQRGGVFEAIGALITNTLPSKEASIDIKTGPEETRISVGDFGEMVVRPLKGATGEYTRLVHGAFTFRDNVILAKGSGSYWRDPEMRQWDSGGHAEQADFDWSA
jgi:hypothetical protein